MCTFVGNPKATEMTSRDVEDFIEQNRQLADLVETFRLVSESDKHWKSRREFIFRNIKNYDLDHLLALSMVWANNAFLGCRYSPDLLEKVNVMAEGIVEDAPVFKIRDEIMKQQAPENTSNQQLPVNKTIKAEDGKAQSEASEEVVPLKKKKKNKRERKEEQQQRKKKEKRAHSNPNGKEEEPQQLSEGGFEKEKRKIEDMEDHTTTQSGSTNEDAERKSKKSQEDILEGKFNWKRTIKAVLRQSPEEGIAVKKLRKKVLAAYFSFIGDRNFRSEEELFSLFNKKISGNPKFNVVKDKVRLEK